MNTLVIVAVISVVLSLISYQASRIFFLKELNKVEKEMKTQREEFRKRNGFSC